MRATDVEEEGQFRDKEDGAVGSGAKRKWLETVWWELGYY